MSGLNLRPHHTLCAQFFEGKRYGEPFVTHMYGICETVEKLRTKANAKAR